MTYESLTVWQAGKYSVSVYYNGFETAEAAHAFGENDALDLIFNPDASTLSLVEPSGTSHPLENSQVKTFQLKKSAQGKLTFLMTDFEEAGITIEDFQQYDEFRHGFEKFLFAVRKIK